MFRERGGHGDRARLPRPEQRGVERAGVRDVVFRLSVGRDGEVERARLFGLRRGVVVGSEQGSIDFAVPVVKGWRGDRPFVPLLP